VREYRLRPESGFRVDFDEVRKLVDSRTALLVACSPHNPTGAVLSADEQRQLHDLAVERGALFVSDEVYRPLFFGPAVPTAASLPQGIVAGDFSKALSLSGLRLGWLIERDPARREEFLRARTYFTISGSPVTESLALLALRHRDAILGKAADTCRRNLAALETFADRNADLFGFVPPKGGTISFPWLTFTDDSRPFCEAAAREGVLLAPGDTFGEPRHFRLGFGAVPDIEEALPILEGVLRRYAAEHIGIASARA
jgi:aspartate/methionine/tyrosine aminotransferase